VETEIGQSCCLVTESNVKPRTISVGHCNGPFILKDESDLDHFFQNNKILLPKSNELQGISSTDLNQLRNVINLDWWPKILVNEKSILPNSPILKYEYLPNIKVSKILKNP